MTREEMIDEAVRTTCGPFTLREMLKDASMYRTSYFKKVRRGDLAFIREKFHRIASREAER